MSLTYLAIDPGLANGVAGYDEEGKIKFLQVVQYDQLWDFLYNLPETIKLIIIEDFKLYPNKASQMPYDSMIAPQAIGTVDAYSKFRGIKLVKQLAQNKTMGFKYLGKKEPSRSSVSHSAVAHAHGVFWLVNNGIIDPKTLVKKGLNED